MGFDDGCLSAEVFPLKNFSKHSVCRWWTPNKKRLINAPSAGVSCQKCSSRVYPVNTVSCSFILFSFVVHQGPVLTWLTLSFCYNVIYFNLRPTIWFIQNSNIIIMIVHLDFSAAGDYIMKYSGLESKHSCTRYWLCRYDIIIRPEDLCKEKMVVEDIKDGLFICVDVGGKWYVLVHPSISGFFIYVNFHQ